MKNKISDKIVTIRIPKELHEKFKDKCNEEYRTVSEAIRSLIVQELKKESK